MSVAPELGDARAYAYAYLCFALTAVLILAAALPPFQGPDEPSHFKRADQVSRGVLVGTRISETAAGGTVTAGIDAVMGHFGVIGTHPDVKATAEMFRAAGTISWANAGVAPTDFSNTAVYPPLLYLPSVAGIWVGKLAGLKIVTTLYLSRAAMGVVSVAIGTLAIMLAGGASPWLFALLSLPMSLSLMASVSQDGPLIALAALAAASFMRMSQGLAPRRLFVTLCASIALIAMPRPVYAVFVVFPLLAPATRLSTRIAGAAAIVASIAAWTLIVAPIAGLALGPDTQAPEQVAFLLAHPGAVLALLIHTVSTLATLYAESFVGRLGWLDTPLMPSYYVFAWIMLAVAALAAAVRLRVPPRPLTVVLVAGAILAAFTGILLISYAAWTKPGTDVILGMQGRYLVPLALFLAAVIPALGRLPGAERIARASFALLWVFPPLTIAVTVFVVIRRYYV